MVRPNQLEAGGSVRLKCTASVLDLYWRSSEVDYYYFLNYYYYYYYYYYY